MAIAFVAATNALTADSLVDTSLTLPLPSSTVGDVILCWINCINGTATAPTITGPTSETWTLIGTTTDGAAPQLRASLYVRRIDGSELGSSVFTFSTGAHAAGVMSAYRGVSPATAYTNASVDPYGGSDANKTTASVTTTDSGWIVSGFGDRSSGTYSALTDTSRATARVATSSRSSVVLQDSNADVAAGSQTRTATGPGGTSVGSSFILRLNPDSMVTGVGTPTVTAYPARAVRSPLKEWLFDKGSLYIAHRGGSVDYVEFTAAAYAACAALKIEAIEMSVYRTSDGVYVLHHDTNTSRVFGDSYDVATTPWSTLSTLRTINGNHPMARLDDELAKYASSKIIFIENKTGTNNSLLLDYLDTFPDSTGHFVLKGFYNNAMAVAARLRGYITWGYYYEENLGDLDSTHEKFDILSLEFNDSAPAWAQILAKGKPVTGHVNLSLANVNQSFASGAYGVMTGKIATVVPNAPASPITNTAVAYDAVATGTGNPTGGSASASVEAYTATTNVGAFTQADGAEIATQAVAYNATVQTITGPVAPFAEPIFINAEAFDADVLASGFEAYFITPTRRESPMIRHGLWSRMHIDVGVTILKKDGFYTQHIDPSPEEITAADEVYIGGHVYPISLSEALDLQAAGYDHWVVNDPEAHIEEIDLGI